MPLKRRFSEFHNLIVRVKLFSRQIPDEDLLELRQVMAKFLLQKSRERADTIWQNKGYDSSTMGQLLSDDV